MTNDPQAQHENPEINLLMKSAFELAQALQINRLLIQIDHDRDTQMIGTLRDSERIIWATWRLCHQPHGDGRIGRHVSR